MIDEKACDPDAMLRGSVMQQTSEMMVLPPLLLLVMSLFGSDHMLEHDGMQSTRRRATQTRC